MEREIKERERKEVPENPQQSLLGADTQGPRRVSQPTPVVLE